MNSSDGMYMMPEIIELQKVITEKLHDLPHIINAPNFTFDNADSNYDALQEGLRTSLDTMHRDVINSIMNYIDNSGYLLSDNSSYDPAANQLAANFIPKFGVVQAHEQGDLLALLKLFAFYAIKTKKIELTPEMGSKVAEWYAKAQPILTEMNNKSFNTKLQTLNKGLTDKTKPYMIGPDNLKVLREHLKQPMKDGIFSRDSQVDRTYLSNLLTFYNSGSLSAYKHIVNNVGILKEPFFQTTVEPEAKVPLKDAIKNVKDSTKSFGGKGAELNDDESKALKKKNPDQHKEYMKHVYALRESYRQEIRKLVRNSKRDKLPVADIISDLNKLKIPIDFIPKGFDGFYDENMDMYAKNGLQFKSNIKGGIYIPNKTYDPKKHGDFYIATHKNPSAPGSPEGQKVYTKEHAQSSYDHKKDFVKHNTEQLPKIRSSWRKDMQEAKDPEKTYAHFVEAMYQTSSRPGTDDDGGKTKLKDGSILQTFGLRNMQLKHMKVERDGSVTMKFPGKKGMSQEFHIRPVNEHKRRLIDFIKAKLKEKKDDPSYKNTDPFWTLANDKKMIPGGETIKYIQGKNWKGGLHKFRHMRANELATKYMKDNPFPVKKLTTLADVNAYVKELSVSVGTLLGHKSTNADGIEEPVGDTALKSYIEPTIIEKIYVEHKKPSPAWLEKALVGS